MTCGIKMIGSTATTQISIAVLRARLIVQPRLISDDANAVFVHTGGLPALFAYAEDLGI